MLQTFELRGELNGLQIGSSSAREGQKKAVSSSFTCIDESKSEIKQINKEKRKFLLLRLKLN